MAEVLGLVLVLRGRERRALCCEGCGSRNGGGARARVGKNGRRRGRTRVGELPGLRYGFDSFAAVLMGFGSKLRWLLIYQQKCCLDMTQTFFNHGAGI